jgi:hypothetical protein
LPTQTCFVFLTFIFPHSILGQFLHSQFRFTILLMDPTTLSNVYLIYVINALIMLICSNKDIYLHCLIQINIHLLKLYFLPIHYIYILCYINILYCTIMVFIFVSIYRFNIMNSLFRSLLILFYILYWIWPNGRLLFNK